MPFFIRKKNPGKRNVLGKGQEKKVKRKKLSGGNAEIESDIDSDFETQEAADKDISEEETETAQEKKLRLAKQYLAHLAAEEISKKGEDSQGEEERNAAVNDRLQQEMLAERGTLQKTVADQYLAPDPVEIRVLKGHKLSVTCTVITPDDKFIFSAAKDCSIIKWSIKSGQKVHVIPGGRKGTESRHIGHTDHILALAISSDGKFLASGGRNKVIHIWNPEDCKLIHTFKGHRAVVSGLAFRKASHQLFSASHDRSVKVWDLDEMAYVETLFGHQDYITGIDSLSRECAVTSGGRDGTVRIWKIVEESQLVFHDYQASIDCVSLINESNFVSGSDVNSLSLWSVMKKKPLTCYKNAHSGEMNGNSGTSSDNWISAVVSLQYTDLIASGSKDGNIRFWKCCVNSKVLLPLFSVRLVGIINSLQFSKDGTFLVAGVGQEHRLGRWWRIKEAKNSVCIISMKKESTSQEVDT